MSVTEVKDMTQLSKHTSKHRVAVCTYKATGKGAEAAKLALAKEMGADDAKRILFVQQYTPIAHEMKLDFIDNGFHIIMLEKGLVDYGRDAYEDVMTNFNLAYCSGKGWKDVVSEMKHLLKKNVKKNED